MGIDSDKDGNSLNFITQNNISNPICNIICFLRRIGEVIEAEVAIIKLQKGKNGE